MKNVSKKRKDVPIITSYAFHRPSFTIRRKDHPTENGRSVQSISGSYEGAAGTVDIYGESDIHAGTKATPAPHIRFSTMYQGRSYTMYFNEVLSDDTLRVRAGRFLQQVELMAAAGVKRSEFGAEVAPVATLMPVGWKPAESVTETAAGS